MATTKTRWITEMLIVTRKAVEGREIAEALGLVQVVTVRAKHVGADIVASLKGFFGGEVTGYFSLMAGAREQAIDRMLAEARGLGADAIVCARLERATIASGTAEILAYGSAVRLA